METIYDYLRLNATELGQRILESYPALHQVGDEPSPLISRLLREPFPAQTLAIMGLAKRWNLARTAKVVAECGTGKTLISLGAMYVHSQGRPFTALAMAPPHLVEKWAREAFLTIPGIRVFMIDDLRNGGEERAPHGVNEVRLKRGRIARDGLRTCLSDLRLAKQGASGKERWRTLCHGPALFIVGRERAKLSYFWRHAYMKPQSGKYRGCVVNPASGEPVFCDDRRLTAAEFDKTRVSQVLSENSGKRRRLLCAPLWQADNKKIARMAPIDFIGRYMAGWFDYAICDELHQLAGDTAQGNALGTLSVCARRTVGLTGTLLGGYADDLYNILFRMQASRMVTKGFAWGSSGRSAFSQDYGVLETITKVEAAENACSDAKSTVTVRRKPGASPLLFGEFLMDSSAFVFLEDISHALPSYEESVVPVAMDAPMEESYSRLEDAIAEALKEHRGNRSLLSIMLNTLLLYPDHPYGLGTLYGWEQDEQGRKQRFVIARTEDLPQQFAYAKERRLVEEIKSELAQGRRCQVFAVYTQKRDVTARLQRVLQEEGIVCAVLRSDIDTCKREAWYERRLREGVQVVIAHPKLVETGLDLLEFPSILFYETGYSLHTLRQASRRSWRIGQDRPVRVKFLCYEQTMQSNCIRLMGKKLLVALAMEGKFAGEGLHSLDEDDDMLTAMARELVEKNRIGESADAVWKQLNAEHQQLFPGRKPLNAAAEADVEGESLCPAGIIDAALDAQPVLVFGQRPSELRVARRRLSREPVAEQGSLFS